MGVFEEAGDQAAAALNLSLSGGNKGAVAIRWATSGPACRPRFRERLIL
jgi:hypothetical protein